MVVKSFKTNRDDDNKFDTSDSECDFPHGYINNESDFELGTSRYISLTLVMFYKKSKCLLKEEELGRRDVRIDLKMFRSAKNQLQKVRVFSQPKGKKILTCL